MGTTQGCEVLFWTNLEAVPYKTAVVWPPISHLTGYPSMTNKTCWAMLEKYGWIHKWHSSIDSYTAVWADWQRKLILQRAITDWDEWWERVKRIHAVGTPWWWWWWWWTRVSCLGRQPDENLEFKTRVSKLVLCCLQPCSGNSVTQLVARCINPWTKLVMRKVETRCIGKCWSSVQLKN